MLRKAILFELRNPIFEKIGFLKPRARVFKVLQEPQAFRIFH